MNIKRCLRISLYEYFVLIIVLIERFQELIKLEKFLEELSTCGYGFFLDID